MKKKIILLALAICITALANAITVVGTAGGLKTTLSNSYKIDTITTLTVTGYIDARDFRTMRDEMTALTSIDLSKVLIYSYTGTEGTQSNTLSYTYEGSSIPTAAFQSKASLKKIILPTSAGSIDWIAFNGCNNLDSIYIPKGISTIAEDVFTGKVQIIVDAANPTYSSLDGVLYNKNKTTLIFCPTSKTGTFILPTSVTSIAKAAFNSCENITNITLPASLTSIGFNAFEGCSSLQSIDIPEGVTELLEEEFLACTSLTTVKLPNSLTHIGISTFNNCSTLVDINFPSSLKTIDDGAFTNCVSLQSISIPQSVTEIFDHAFSGCSGLKTIFVANTNPVSLDGTIGVFNNVDTLTCTLHVPANSKALYESASIWKSFKQITENVITKTNKTKLNLQTKLAGNSLFITGIPTNTLVTVYSINNQVIYSKKTNEETANINLPTHGVYIIHVGNESVKVVY